MATGDQQITKSSQAWTESPYRFTQPVRLFKANDPYYWEVDNLPLEQLEENILWIKDQIATSTFVSGVGRSDLAELRPFANGASRTVFVQPGRYTARINDAYQKGIGTHALAQRAVIDTLQRESHTFTYSDAEISALLGDATETVFLNNGLYDHLQHHNSESTSPNGFLLDWRHGFSYFTQNNKGINEVMNLPKNKLALWKRSSTFPSLIDLQQAATEFTRIYGGAVRTSIVNVPEQLEINIPEFDVNEHRVGTTAQPQVRVDLLFLYSHPIDASSTTIPSPNGSNPTTIFAPRLGLLKGAGVVSVSALSNTIATNLSGVTGYVSSSEYDAASFGDNSFRFDMGEGVDENGHTVMNAPAADQLQTAAGINNVYGSFPSPDDVMNLAPMFAEQVETGDNQYNLIGQSILPLAYIFVKRNKALVEQADLVDIRPFFRTTELAYNERAGVAAASPPLSFANPAVGKQELRDTSYKVKRDLQTQISPVLSDVATLNDQGKLISTGMILGGTKWGVEGALAAYMQEAGLFPAQNAADMLLGLHQHGHIPTSITELPLYPGWDINHDYFDQYGSAGSKRNDRIFSSVKFGYGDTTADRPNWNRGANNLDVPESLYEGDLLSSDFWNHTNSMFGIRRVSSYSMHGCVFVKKDIEFADGMMDQYVDYDVNASLVGCAIQNNASLLSRDYVALGAGFGGVSVQKRGKKGFTIIVALGPPSVSENWQWFGKPVGGQTNALVYDPNQDNPGIDMEYYLRESPVASKVLVLSKEVVQNGTQHGSIGTQVESGGGLYQQQHDLETFGATIVTYPTVQFSVIGYESGNRITNFFSTSPTNPGSSVLTIS